MPDAERIEIADDFLVMTVGLYEFFMANDANDQLRVYLHLLYTARRQQTRSVWANTPYISKGCGMGIGRVKAAKAWLAEHGVIEYRQNAEPGKRGKGKVFTVLNTTIRSGGTEISHPENQPSCKPTHEVLREQEELPREEGKEETSPTGDTPEAALPAAEIQHHGANGNGHKKTGKVREAIWQELADLTVERGGHWTAGMKEAVCMTRLIAWAKIEKPEQWEQFLRDFMDGAWALHTGGVFGLKQNDASWWRRQPYTPSRLLSNAASICATLEQIAEANREPTQEEIRFATMGRK